MTGAQDGDQERFIRNFSLFWAQARLPLEESDRMMRQLMPAERRFERDRDAIRRGLRILLGSRVIDLSKSPKHYGSTGMSSFLQNHEGGMRP